MWKALTGGSKKNQARGKEESSDIPLHDAIHRKDLKEVKKVLDRAGESAVSRADAVGRNGLHLAGECGDLDIVKAVLKSVRDRALINAVDRAGITPLFVAAQSGSAKAVRELVKAGADATAKTTNGETMLHAPFLAPFLTKGHTTVVKELCALETVDLAAVDTAGLCALQLACRKNAYDCVLVLIKAKADTALVKGGEPPLFYATMAENPALVKVLLEAGADIAQPSSSGQSLMEVVNPKCEIYRIIKKHVITRPGGARKLNLMSEESIVATSLSDLPLEILQLVNKAGLKEADIAANWQVFCNIIHMICNRRIFSTPEEAVAARENQVKKGGDTSEEEKSLRVHLLTSGDPQKIFRKMRVAGAGGFGMVFQGTGPDKKQWAIKRMGHSSDKERIQNLRECMFLKSLTHPNICAYKATYECQQQHELWLIMELMQGGTLDESVGNQSEEATHFFEEKHLAYTAGEILKALEYMHGRNVVHRDLKSQNVMFTLQGEVKIIDFGTAMSVEEGKHPKECVGSPYWMPPEMILRNPHGAPCDVWSMAVCLLELANHHPPDNTSVLRHMFRVATAAPPFLDHPEKWSELMRDFLSQCMQFDPTRRATAAVLHRHKWVTSRACPQAEMSTMLNTIFASRFFNDV